MAARPLSNPPRILAIHAHPDDVEIQVAGTLGLLKQKGCVITIATMTPGDCGTAELSAEEISRVRRAEARKAADLIGADYVCVEFRDLAIVHDNESRRRVTEVVRRARPDIVFTAPPIDYMSDHEVTSRLVRDACFAASAPNYSTHQWEPAPPTDAIPYLYYVDPVDGMDWYGNQQPPHFLVDVTSTFDLKRDMLACHESQRNWLRRQHGIDEYMDMQQRWSAHRGQQYGGGAEYAEGFTQHKGHPFPGDNVLATLIAGVKEC